MDEALFKKVPVKVQQKSGFDLSFQNLLTTKVGTITPLLCEEVIPNETVHLRAAIQAQLPPLASDTFMRCNLKYEAFFVPNRIIFPGYEGWLVPGSTTQSQQTATYRPISPVITLRSDDVQRGSLADYLGFKSNIPDNYTTEENKTISVNALPFIAYHKIYDDWYRNSLIQTPVFRDAIYSASTGGYNAANCLAVSPCTNRGNTISVVNSNTSTLASRVFMDNVDICDLRQRNFGIDYFTSATASAQNGQEQGLVMSVTNNATGFTIGQLRAANSIQQWLERNNLAGNRLVDYVKANYGANLSYGVAQKSVLLGSGEFPVYSKGIYQTSNESQYNYSTRNPFDAVGAKYGSAFAAGEETIIENFTAQEPGYLFVMVTLVPKVTYSTGIDKKLLRYVNNDRSDMANPLLQNVGQEPIYSSELIADYAFQQQNLMSQVFGYVDRYASWKSKNDELHGLLRDNNTYQGFSQGVNVDNGGILAPFALQSSFDLSHNSQISTNFLQIPTDYMDQVSATAADTVSKYGVWIDSYLDFKVSMPLARYSMPSLQDPAYEHGDTIVLDRGGKRL